MNNSISIFWFRRDLRLEDNVGLFHALTSGIPVLPIFIFDPEILDKLPKRDARVNFIHDCLTNMNRNLQRKHHTTISIYHGQPHEIFKTLLNKFNIVSVVTNRDYEPYARERDKIIEELLRQQGVPFQTYKDHVIFEKGDVLKDDASPYVVYTPYKRRWKQHFDTAKHLREYNSEQHLANFFDSSHTSDFSLEKLGFEPSNIKVPDFKISSHLIKYYEENRDIPSLENGTSRLGPHLRFGTISIRKVIKKAIREENETFWNELIWREFFIQILWHFPHTVTTAFKPKYDGIKWRNNIAEFALWKTGRTGYPLVDAGMRELNTTGYMHNRVRMLTASFLCKHLLIDWRWGEAYFALKLLDFELASNVGNWQWACGSGVDAAPYFRIFNPALQLHKFDSQGTYIQKWIPEFQQLTYPSEIVDHKMARERCLKIYKAAVG